MVCFTLYLCTLLLVIYFKHTVQHFVKPPSSCVAAEICNHTGISICGLDKHISNYRHFLDECDMLEYNCDNKREYSTSNMKNCQQNSESITTDIMTSEMEQTYSTASSLESSVNSMEGISRTENTESSMSNPLTDNENNQAISTTPTTLSTSAQREYTSLHSAHISQSTVINSSQIETTTIIVTPNIYNKCTCDAVQESNTSTNVLTTPITTTETETTATVIMTENSLRSSLKTDSSVSITTPYIVNKCTCGLKDVDVHTPPGTTETSPSVKTTKTTETSQVIKTSVASLTTEIYQTTEIPSITSTSTSQITKASTKPIKSTDMKFNTKNTSTVVPNIGNPCTCSANIIDTTTKKIDTTTTIASTTTTSSKAYTTVSENLTSPKVTTVATNSIGHCTCGLLTTETTIPTFTFTESIKSISPSLNTDNNKGEFKNIIPESDGSFQKGNTSNLFIDSTLTATQNILNHCTCGDNTPMKKTETTTMPTVPSTKTYLTTIPTPIHTKESQTEIPTTPAERHCTCGLSSDKPNLTTTSSKGNEDIHQTVTKTKEVECGKYPNDCDRPHTWETTAKGETRDFFQILKARYGTRLRFLRATTHYPFQRDKPIVNNDVSIFMFGQHNDV